MGGLMMFDNMEEDTFEVKIRRESSESYHNVVFTSANYRVIVCRDNIQWIIQLRRGKSGVKQRWIPLKYCTTKNALIREWHSLIGQFHPMLDKLPERIGGNS
jgi:hypothetical protein